MKHFSIHELTGQLHGLVRTRLWIKILMALVLGLILGVILGPPTAWVPEDTARHLGQWLSLPGQIFLGLIQLVVVPLVFASVIQGIVSGGTFQRLKTLGTKIFVYYLATTVVSISFGLGVAYLVRPGENLQSAIQLKETPPATGVPSSTPLELSSVVEVLPKLLPGNPFQALVSGQMLEGVILALFFGMALLSLSSEEAHPLVQLVGSIQKISMVVIGWAMGLAPYAVFGLTAQMLSQYGPAAMLGLGTYVLTVLLGLALILLFYSVLLLIVARKRPGPFFRSIRDVQLLAFSTSSSASVMPLTLETAEKKLGVRPSISRLIIPLGTTINMDGTALYQGVATVFMAQVFGIELTLSQVGLVVVTATLSSVGAPGTPGVGIAVLALILKSVGIPTEGVVLIMGVDRILDMCRTVINVTGDLVASLVMNRLVKADPTEGLERSGSLGALPQGGR